MSTIFKRDLNVRYNYRDFGKKEEELQMKYQAQVSDGKNYFLSILRPRYDGFYKLYNSYNGDRAKEIKKWNSNVFVPYVHGVVETLIPRIIDARPEFSVLPRREDLAERGEKQQQLANFFWEKSQMDAVNEDHVRTGLIFGTAFLQNSWKKEVRTAKYLSTKDLSQKKLKWVPRDEVIYDAPFTENVDIYSLLYDWRNCERRLKRFWMKRMVLHDDEIIRRYPMADPLRLNMALNTTGDIEDYGSVRLDIKGSNSKISRKALSNYAYSPSFPIDYVDVDGKKLHEVIEWTMPYDDSYAVMVNEVPIFPNGEMPILYDFKEAPFIETTYLKLPNEFEGVGIPAVLENPQIMLNTIKNQRIDTATLSIHKMWAVNPMANINKEDLITRPFGIIYTMEINGIKPIEFSDVKPSSYKEEDALKSDMRYASGVDDASMGGGGGASSATEVRHLRESTLERVRLFVNHLGATYSNVLRHWMSLQRQFFTESMTIRVLGEGGENVYPLIEKDDLFGEYDYRALVLPSIAGANDVEKKQNMDLFSLLVTLPFVDAEKLTAKTLRPFNFSLASIKKDETEMQSAEMSPEGMPPEEGAMPMDAMGAMPPEVMGQGNAQLPGNIIPPQVLSDALAMIRGGSVQQGSQFSAAASPINLLQNPSAMPPTAKGIPPGGTTNPRGNSRKLGGKVNTNIPMRPTDIGASEQRKVSNIQR